MNNLHAVPDTKIGAAAFKVANAAAGAAGVAGDGSESGPTIQYEEGSLPAVVDAAEDALLAAEVPIYQRGGQLVRVIRRPPISTRAFKAAGGAMGLVAVDTPFLIETLTKVARFLRWNRRSQSWQLMNCPDRVAVTYLSRVGLWRVPRLWAAIDAPTLRPDGSILQVPGYDADTAVLFQPGDAFPAIPDRPTKKQADEALDLIACSIGSFPFLEPLDRSVALALILTALVRRSLPGAPLGAITATIMASGKTLLADVIAIIATGVSAPVMAHPASEEEAAKMLLSLLSEGVPVLVLDNIETALGGSWICSVLTSESYSARRLGANSMAVVPTSTTWLATGNSLQITGDLRTRALLCRIDPRMERPEEREFVGDLREEIARRRPELVVAGLTVMRAFIVSGVAPGDLVRPWGRFEHWSDRCRAPLVWLGYADPCLSLKQLEADDPERTRHIAMLRAWSVAFQAHPTSVREAIDAAIHDPTLREAFEPVCRDRSGQLDAARLGKWLRRHMGRIACGCEFLRAGDRQGSALWSVKGDLNGLG